MNFNILRNVFGVLLLAICLLDAAVFCLPVELKDISDGDIDYKIDPSEYYGNLSPLTIRKIQKCDRDSDTMELCMRCAKVTRSDIVYPLCCENEDNVKDWCHDYIFFGIQN